MPKEVLKELRTCHGGIFGSVMQPRYQEPNYVSPIVTIRQEMGLYGNIRHLSDMTRYIDFVVVREATECLFVRQETLNPDGSYATAKRVVTREASERIAKLAFSLAAARAQAKLELHGGSVKVNPMVTAVHKANILPLSDGLFLGSCQKVAKTFPSVRYDELVLDTCASEIVLHPQKFDVIVAANTYGDVLSDVAAAVVGGLYVVFVVPSVFSFSSHPWL